MIPLIVVNFSICPFEIFGYRYKIPQCKLVEIKYVTEMWRWDTNFRRLRLGHKNQSVSPLGPFSFFHPSLMAEIEALWSLQLLNPQYLEWCLVHCMHSSNICWMDRNRWIWYPNHRVPGPESTDSIFCFV